MNDILSRELEVNYKYNAEQVHILGNRPVMGQECRQAQNTGTWQCKQKPHVMTKKKKKHESSTCHTRNHAALGGGIHEISFAFLAFIIIYLK